MSPVPDILMQLLQTIHDDLQELKSEQKEIKQTIADHIETEQKEWADLMRETLGCAFPNCDPEGHRRYHEDTISAMEARSKFWKQMLFEVTKYGLFGVLGWLAYTLWAAFLHGPGK